MSSKVYFTDMHVGMGDSLLDKFERLITKAGIDQIDFQDKFVAVKLHFGEFGNMAFLRQQYAKVLCDHIKAKGGKPFLTDCNTLYVGYRNNALNHLDAAYMNGYNWDALLRYYLEKHEPDILKGLDPDPEAGSYVAIWPLSPENEARAKRFAEIIRSLVEHEEELCRLVQEEGGEIEWD